MVDVYSVANTLFREASKLDIKIKNLPKLQSLLFFAQYYYYKNFQTELIDEVFYKGEIHPFIPSLRRILKIENLLDENENFVNGGDIIISFPYYEEFENSEILSKAEFCAGTIKPNSDTRKFIKHFLYNFGDCSLLDFYGLFARNEKILNIRYNENPITTMLTAEEIIKCEF